MWNDNDIFANDIADKLEQKMFCNFGGGSSPSSSGGESRGVSIAGGTLRGGTTAGNVGGGSGTGGYDVLGTGVIDNSRFDATRVGTDPTAIGMTLQDIAGGSSDDAAYVAAIQAGVDRQLAEQAVQRLQQTGLPQQIKQGFAVGTSPYAQLSARGNLNQLPNFGIMSALNALGKRTASGIMERIQGGGIPVYDKTGQIVGVRTRNEVGDRVMEFMGEKLGFEPEPTYSYFGRPDYDPNAGQATPIEDEFGNIIGFEAVPSILQEDDDGGYVAPEATVVAAAQPDVKEKSMIPMGYRYPVGGVYAKDGEYMRTGLLDVAPTTYGGLLAGYDPTQFGAMNVGFREPTDVGLFVDPYDVKGYTRIS
jgi:hypothetical protein